MASTVRVESAQEDRFMRRVPRMLVITIVCSAAFSCGDGGHHNDNESPGPTPVPTSTAAAQMPCPTKITYTVKDTGTDLDIGSTGIYFDQTLPAGGSLTFAVACPGPQLGACG